MFPYFLLTILEVILARLGSKHLWARIAAFTLVALFVGLRYNVGTDYESYADYYYTKYFFLEPGFNWLVELLWKYNYGEVFLFLIMAISTYLFAYLGIEKNKDIDDYSPVILMLTLLTVTTTCNGIRQAFAASVFFCATRFIRSRNILPFIALIAFAFLFHRSVLLVLPFYFFNDKYLKKWMYVVIYIVSFIFVSYDLQTIMGPLQFLIASNDRYMNMVENNYGNSYLGLGNLLQILSYVVLLWLALKNDMHKKQPLYFNLFFVLCVLMNVRIGASLFGRVMMYFSWFMFLLLPLTLKEEKNGNVRLVIVVYYVAWFIVSAINYIAFDPSSHMNPYHDILGIF